MQNVRIVKGVENLKISYDFMFGEDAFISRGLGGFRALFMFNLFLFVKFYMKI